MSFCEEYREKKVFYLYQQMHSWYK